MSRFYSHRKNFLPWVMVALTLGYLYFYQKCEIKDVPTKMDIEESACCSQSKFIRQYPERGNLSENIFNRKSILNTSVTLTSIKPATSVLSNTGHSAGGSVNSDGTNIKTDINSSSKMIPLDAASRQEPSDEMDAYHFNDTVSFSDGADAVNPHPFVFTMNPIETCTGVNTFLLILIHSHPDNFERRQVVRETWGNASWFKHQVVRRVFIMGETLNPAHAHLLNMEDMVYRDIVQENFLDTYRNLTYKAIAGLKWATTHCNNVKFILKADDDAFVNTFVILRHLKAKLNSGEYGKGTLACHIWKKPPVYREGKWAVTVEERKHPFWPDYCQGLAYLYTPDVAAAFYSASFDVPYLWIDDVYVTGFLTRRLRIERLELRKTFIHERNLASCIGDWDLYRCIFSHVTKVNVTVSLWIRLVSKTHLLK